MAKANKHRQEEAALIELFARKDYQAIETRACALCRNYPKHGFYWKALGTARNMLGNLPASAEALQTAARLLPADAELLSNLGCTLRKLKRTDEAETAFLKALQRNPDSAPALNNLGFLYKDLERYEEAETVLRRALELCPGYGEALNNLGMVLSCMGRYEEAQTVLREVLAQTPDYPEAWNNLGIALDGKPKEAEPAFRNALAYRPLFPQASIGLANCLKEQGRVEEGLAVLRASLDTSPEHQESYVSLGGLLMELGDIAASEQAFAKALKLDPKDTAAHSLRMFCMTYSDAFSTAQRLEAAHGFGKALSNKAKPYVEWQRPKSQRLRIGMVSGDFRKHPVGYFLENVLPHLASDSVELFAYSSNRKADELTERLRPFFQHWTLIQGKSDRDAARHIHDDGLDILLDLSGHTAFNRLGVFAYRPAPVQASWLGYWATTGVEQMDVFIADNAGVPTPSAQPFTEKVCTLPTRLCFSSPENAPAVAPLPAFTKGCVTFGCFQNMSKISDATLRLWEPLFAALPSARLRLQAKQLKDPTARERILSRLAAHGITADRVELAGPTERLEYLAAHAEVDIILDTVPYNGGTTTCEGLWMDVPTLTLAGESLIARQGASLLTAAGLADWITTNAEDYTARAVFWATHLEKLADVREGLREHVTGSLLFNGKAFASSLLELLAKLGGKKTEAIIGAAPSTHGIQKGKKMQKLLHVGCGPQHILGQHGFDTANWQELRLDIDHSVSPDIIGTMTDMSSVQDDSMDAVYSSHNIEHLHPHEVPSALSEFLRVLRPDGFLVITCPDLQSVCALVAEGKLLEPAYHTAAGLPIAPLDILYGWRQAMIQGNLYMAHKCGFTETALRDTLRQSGFARVASICRKREFTLYAVATKHNVSDETLRSLATQYLFY